MRKNKSVTYTYFLLAGLAVLLILIVPGNLQAQEEETEEAIKIIQLVPQKKDFFAFFFKTFPSLFLKLLPIIAIAAFIKVWLLKRKLSIPWKWTQMEKLSIAALAETAVGVFLLFLVIAFFTPAISSVLTDSLKVTFADTPGSQTLKFFIHTLVALPFYCIISGLIILVLIHLLKPIEKEERGRYYKYGAFLALITPVLLVVFVFVSRILVKWSYI
ncbi:MAG: hypothetical protein GTO45_35800 [Candidatus Aminicenantes bacterium]|nr:hypothetical protein [Candidatus Aminicenantes bacterium]NIM84053.1 hypothetical protein [Candidatus Aminicenantes bacterium]NIN23517.1 hypothetical protein [Candidatus Aminicenantes bacterium]NIN47222.1 hypothetical protein [Candidatus Aminicenantes bacterium]NIN90148.1 hypothetical protein [Candidatus Aminicenantes bacterium]